MGSSSGAAQPAPGDRWGAGAGGRPSVVPAPSESQEDSDRGGGNEPRWPGLHPTQSSRVVFALSLPALPVSGAQG